MEGDSHRPLAGHQLALLLALSPPHLGKLSPTAICHDMSYWDWRVTSHTSGGREICPVSPGILGSSRKAAAKTHYPCGGGPGLVHPLYSPPPHTRRRGLPQYMQSGRGPKADSLRHLKARWARSLSHQSSLSYCLFPLHWPGGWPSTRSSY